MEKKPNVLIIQPEQHRSPVMKCAGDRQVITPNLDRFADEGVRFSRCASSSPVCAPFRATLQTGLYPHKHGLDRNNIPLDPQLTTIAELFAGKGYVTGYIGKWHLDGGIPDEQPGGYIEPGPKRRGWQEWYGYEKNHDHFKVWKYDENRRQVLIEGYNWEPTWHTDMALDFARRHRDQDRPWIYYLAYGPMNDPAKCPSKFLNMYDPDAFELPPDLVGRFSAKDEKRLRELFQVYYGQVTAIDFEIGRILKGFKELGIDRNTIILYMSDHGDKLGSHASPERLRGKEAPFATAFRIPLIIRWPEKIKPKQVYDCLVSSVDLTPTILDLAGLEIPSIMQGDSMAGWCLEGKGKSNEALYLGLGGITEAGWRGVWDGRFVYSPGRFNILYDHQTDPYEQNNLIDSPSHAEVRKRMHSLLLKLAKKTEDPMYQELKQL